jgi:hypothetical protein
LAILVSSAGIGNAGQGQQLADVGLVLLAQFGHAAIAEVEITVRQAQSALHQVRCGACRLQQVHRYPQPEQAVGIEIGGIEQVHVGAYIGAQRACQAGLVGQRVDRLQLRLHRRQPALLDPGFVHEGGVVIADQLVVATGLGVVGGTFQDGAGVGLGLFGDHVEAAEARAIGRDLGVLDPAAVGEIEEIVTGGDAAVHAVGVETEAAQLRRGRLRGRCLLGCFGRGGRGVAAAGRQGKGQAGGDRQQQGSATQRRHGVLGRRETPSLIPAGGAGCNGNRTETGGRVCRIWLNRGGHSSCRHRRDACCTTGPGGSAFDAEPPGSRQHGQESRSAAA